MPTIHPSDFESTEGRKKIISVLHDSEAKIHRLEQAVHDLGLDEDELRDELRDIVKMEGIEEEDITAESEYRQQSE